MIKKFSMLIALSLMTAHAVFAFDVTTHAAMTIKAVQQSKIGSNPNASELLRRLGIVDSEKMIGQYYMHMGGQVTLTNRVIQMEVDTIENVSKGFGPVPPANSISGWIMRGAIREDDNTVETPYSDEQGGVFNRVYGHFFDTVNNRGLTIFGVTGPRAVDWALYPGQTIGGRKNNFNIATARETMWRALTLKSYDPVAQQVTGDAANPVDAGNATKESIRKAYWATTFRIIGDVVHLVQDMAQPQHTRNDAHSGFGCITGSVCFGGHASFFEAYLKARTIQEPAFTLVGKLAPSSTIETSNKAFKTNTTPLDYCCYDTPQFAGYADYFATATGAGNNSGKGLANYSSRGFYSFGTNIGKTNLPSPTPDGTGLATLAVTSGLVDMVGNPLSGTAYFKTGTVVDTAGGADATGVKLSTLGIWNDALQQKSPSFSSHSLNHYNYDDQARLLIPRAVAYSAGLIDYFFRGKLEVKPTADGVFAVLDQLPAITGAHGFTKIKARIRNATPASGASAEEMTSGNLVAVAKFYRDTCFVPGEGGVYLLPPPGAGVCRSASEEILVSLPKAVPDNVSIPSAAGAGTPVTFEFDPNNPIPVNAIDLSLQFVYRGALGNEPDAVVVETVDVSEPTLVNASNDADYVWDANNIVVATTEQKRIEQTIPAAHFVFAYETAPTLPLTGFSVAAPLAPGKYAAVWTLVDLATPPSYGTANCAACGYSLVPLTPRRVETAPDETTPRLVSAAPYQLRGTWQNNGFSLLTPTIPAGVCTGSFAACVTQNFPPYQSLIPSVRVTVGF